MQSKKSDAKKLKLFNRSKNFTSTPKKTAKKTRNKIIPRELTIDKLAVIDSHSTHSPDEHEVRQMFGVSQTRQRVDL